MVSKIINIEFYIIINLTVGDDEGRKKKKISNMY